MFRINTQYDIHAETGETHRFSTEINLSTSTMESQQIQSEKQEFTQCTFSLDVSLSGRNTDKLYS